MTEEARLKKNLYSHRIPFKTETINAPPLLPTKEAAPRPDSGNGKAPLGQAHTTRTKDLPLGGNSRTATARAESLWIID